MSFYRFALAILATSFISTGAFAQNKSGSDTIFSEPTGDAALTQVILGITDFTVAGYLWRSAKGEYSEEAQAIESAHARLRRAQGMFLTGSDRNTEIERIEGLRSNGDLDEDDAINLIANAKKAPLVTKGEKLSAIEKAENELGRVRARALQIAHDAGPLSKVIKGIKVVGATVFFVDGMSRIYVWHAMDANPTLTPVGTYIKHQISGSR